MYLRSEIEMIVGSPFFFLCPPLIAYQSFFLAFIFSFVYIIIDIDVRTLARPMIFFGYAANGIIFLFLLCISFVKIH